MASETKVVLVGIGPGPVSYMTKEAEEKLLASDKVFFRFRSHPVFAWLTAQGKQTVSFDPLYQKLGAYSEVYDFIAESMVREAIRKGEAVLALPGNPYVMEDTPQLIEHWARKLGVGVEVIPGLSFLELIYAALGLDPGIGVQVVLPHHLKSRSYSPRLTMLIGLVGIAYPHPYSTEKNTGMVQSELLQVYPPDHLVTLVWNSGRPDYETHWKEIRLGLLSDEIPEDYDLGSLLIPPLHAGA